MSHDNADEFPQNESTLTELVTLLQTPDDVVRAFTTHPELRQMDAIMGIAKRLEPRVLAVLARPLNALLELCDLMQSLQSIDSFGELATVVTDDNWYWNHRIGALLASEVKNGNALLKRAHEIRQELETKFQRIMQVSSAEELKEAIKEDASLAHHDFLRLVAERIRFSIRQGEVNVERAWVCIELAEFFGRLIAGTQQIPSKPGFVLLRVPTPPQSAESWFIQQFDQSTFHWILAMQPRLLANPQDVDTILVELQRRVSQQSSNKGTAYRVSVEIAFYRIMINSGEPALIRLGLGRFRNLLGTAQVSSLAADLRGTIAVRYLSSCLLGYQSDGFTRDVLEDAVLVATEALREVDYKLSPRLQRDLLWCRARIKRELTRWVPDQDEDAISDFLAGLHVPTVAFEREARGRALSDLAIALAAAHYEPDSIEASFQEALSLLPKIEFPISRATVLYNYAIWLNERRDGTPSFHQERALELLDLTMDLLRGVLSESQTNWGREVLLLASALLAKGNVLRMRGFGEIGQNQYQAGQCYKQALQYIGGHHRELEGIARLNLAYASYEQENLNEAEQHARQVLSRAQGLFSLEARAKVLVVEIAAARAEPVTEPKRQEAQRLVLEAIESFTQLKEDQGLAKAHRALGLLTRVSADGSRRRLSKAALSFRRAAVIFAQIGDPTSAIAMRLNEADSWMVAAKGEQVALLNHAEEALRAAVTHLKAEWLKPAPIGDRLVLAENWAEACARIAWLYAVQSRPVAEILQWATAAKDVLLVDRIASTTREPVEELRSSDTLRRHARELEVLLLERGEEALPGEHLTAEVNELRDALLDWNPTLSAPTIDGGGVILDDIPEGVFYLDLSTSRWGTVALVISRNDTRVERLRVSTRDLRHWLHHEPGWISHYASWRLHKAADARLQWTKTCAQMSETLSREIVQPALGAVVAQLRGATLYMVPGRLASLPLHLSYVEENVLLFNTIDGFAYLPKVPQTTEQISSPRSFFEQALCVVVDPEIEPQKQLQEPVEEALEAAKIFASRGMEMRIVAAIGEKHGTSVIPPERVPSEQCVVINDRPTPAWLLNAIKDTDFLLYSGHGDVGTLTAGGLRLMDEVGRGRASLSFMRLMSADVLNRRPLILLSACETAMEVSGASATLSSIASCLLRLGASSILATLWLVTDVCARRMSTSFLDAFFKVGAAKAFVRALRDLQPHYSESDFGAFCLWMNVDDRDTST
jgi:hypothetical protein